MKFGFVVPTLTGFHRSQSDRQGGYRERFARSHELCALAESLGYDFAAIGEHRFTPDGLDSSAPLLVISALAARTSRLRFCTNIVILALHDPVELAEQVATLDELSDGRVILGVGLGYRPYEFEQIGLDFRQRVSRFEEAIAVLRAAWRDEPANFEGRHFHLRNANVAPKPVQRPSPPIWIGAQTPPAIDRAARLGDGWLADHIQSATAMQPLIAGFHNAAGNAARPRTLVINRKVAIAPSRAEAEQRYLSRTLDLFRRYPDYGVVFEDQAFLGKLLSGRRMGVDDVPPDQIIAGTPRDCIAALRQVRDLTQCDYVIADFGEACEGEDYQALRDAIEFFGREVIPAFG